MIVVRESLSDPSGEVAKGLAFLRQLTQFAKLAVQAITVLPSHGHTVSHPASDPEAASFLSTISRADSGASQSWRLCALAPKS